MFAVNIEEQEVRDKVRTMIGTKIFGSFPTTMMILLLLSSFLLEFSYAEIREFKGTIEADATFIHYSEGYLIAPGFIDLTQMEFRTDDSADDKLTKKDKKDDERNGGGNRQLSSPQRTLYSDSKVDIVFFHEPSSCSDSKNNCDWTTLGVGASDENGNYRWCCSETAMNEGHCEKSSLGQLILKENFTGKQRFVDVPSSGTLKKHFDVGLGKLEVTDESGKYILALANCNDDGRDVIVGGKYTWKSGHGYLPGNLFGEMYFYAYLTGAYFLLTAVFGIKMKMHEDAFIPIQRWILCTIVLGLLETFFRVGDYWVWNEDGTRFYFAMGTWIFIGEVKRGLSRCLLVMVSLGWGVVRDQLDAIHKIIILGTLYVVTAMAQDILDILAIAENEVLSDHAEEELLDATTVVAFIMAAIDITFIVWILYGLDGTMQYLENMNQNRKLARYLRLRCILLFSILFGMMWMVFSLVNIYSPDGGIWEEQSMWVVGGFKQLNYLVVLIAVAYLWRPNPSAKEFAHVMELPTLGEGDDDEHDLQMTENVPSALDDDDDEDGKMDDDNNNQENFGSFKDEPEGKD